RFRIVEGAAEESKHKEESHSVLSMDGGRRAARCPGGGFQHRSQVWPPSIGGIAGRSVGRAVTGVRSRDYSGFDGGRLITRTGLSANQFQPLDAGDPCLIASAVSGVWNAGAARERLGRTVAQDSRLRTLDAAGKEPGHADRGTGAATGADGLSPRSQA